jgi:hypothetical protein
MEGKLFRTAFVFAAGAAVGAGVMWLLSDSGKEKREELRDLAMQAKGKIKERCDQLKQEMEEENGK